MSVRRRVGGFALASAVAMAGVGGVVGPALAADGSWAATGSLNVPDSRPPPPLLDNGKVLVAGGRNFTFTTAFDSAELYDPLTELFTLTGSMANGRWSHTATLLPDGRVLVAGGFGAPTTSANAQPVLAAAEIYDPATGT